MFDGSSRLETSLVDSGSIGCLSILHESQSNWSRCDKSAADRVTCMTDPGPLKENRRWWRRFSWPQTFPYECTLTKKRASMFNCSPSGDPIMLRLPHQQSNRSGSARVFSAFSDNDPVGSSANCRKRWYRPGWLAV